MNSRLNKNHVDWYNQNYYSESDTNLPSWSLRLTLELGRESLKNKKILDLGCGEAKVLSELYKNKDLSPKDLYGIDQSDNAVGLAKKKIPESNIFQGDISELSFQDNYFDYTFLLETIEHLDDPSNTLSEIRRVLKKGGVLFVSFPNYLNLPWFLARVLAQILKKPNWIVLQPIDKIYNVFQVMKKVEGFGFKKENVYGTCYLPPLMYRLENSKFDQLLDKIGLSFLSFHPVIKFVKK